MMNNFGGNMRHGILNLTINNIDQLHESFMPFVEGGGIFVQTKRNYLLGDEVFLLLDLLEEEKVPLTGKVIWSTPKGNGSRREGIGIQLDEKHADLVQKIETLLAGLLESDKPTKTM